MADSSNQLVECPLCETTFNPAVAGGWCTNTDCGEWQYDEETADDDESSADDEPVSVDNDTQDEALAPIVEDATESDKDESDSNNEADVEELMVELAEESKFPEGDKPVAEENEEPKSWFADAEATPVEEADGENSGLDEPEEDDQTESDEDGQAESDEGNQVESEEDDQAEPDSIAVAFEDDAETGEETASPVDRDDESVTGEPLTEREDGESDESVTDEPLGELEEQSDDIEGETDEAEEVGESDSLPAEIACPECGTENDPSANFCKSCGTDIDDIEQEEEPEPLTDRPDCGAAVDEAANFCSTCGYDLEAHRTGAAESTPDTASVPQTLVLTVRGRELAVVDGDTVGRELRRIITETGGDEDEALRIHREHVRFVREDGQFYLVDLGRNPTTLNGESMEKGDRKPIDPGDKLSLSGVATLTVDAPQ